MLKGRQIFAEKAIFIGEVLMPLMELAGILPRTDPAAGLLNN